MKKILLSVALFGATGLGLAAAATHRPLEACAELESQLAAQPAGNYTKQAKKEAKALKKEGWAVTPGTMALEAQLERYYTLANERDGDGNLLYLMAPALSTGQNYDAARMQAIALAKQELAGMIATEVSAEVDNRVANGQMDAEEAVSLVQTVTAGKASLTQSLGRVEVVFECYRSCPTATRKSPSASHTAANS